MKVTNIKSGRSYTVLSSKGDVIAAWCATVKPIVISIDGVKVKVFANPEKSNYIYFRFQGAARCVWAKDSKEFDFLKEKSLKVTDQGRKSKAPVKDAPISAAKAGVKPRTIRVIKGAAKA